MKNTKLTARALLALSLMGALAVAPATTNLARADAPDDATPRAGHDFDRDNDNRDDADRDDNFDRDGARRDNRMGRRDDFDGRGRPGRRNDERGRAGAGRDARGPRDNRAQAGRTDFGRFDDPNNRARIGERNDETGRANFGRYGRPQNGGNAFGRERANRAGDDLTIVPQFVGVVTKVKNNREFDIRMDGKTYNVYLSAAAGAVSAGQTVQLNGERIGTNDIRSATLLAPRRR